MSLDNTAKETNVMDSLKKYFVDNLVTIEGLELSFDRSITAPKIQGSPSEADRWVVVNFGSINRSYMSELTLFVFCCARKDRENFKLARLSDKVLGYLCDSSQTDGMKRIPFYRSRDSGAWTLLGQMLVQDVFVSGNMEAEDETKFKILTARIRFASIV